MCGAVQGKDISDRKRANHLSLLPAVKNPVSMLQISLQIRDQLILKKSKKKESMRCLWHT